MNSKCYMNLLDVGLISDCRPLYPEKLFHFPTGWAPSHTSCATPEQVKIFS